MSLRKATIQLAYERPELRPHLLPLLARTAASEDEEAMDILAGRTWGRGDHGEGDPGAAVDDNVPYRSHPQSPPGGANGSAQRKKYNEWYRENVCPSNHKTTCGNPALKK
jgi:hypothetical protein